MLREWETLLMNHFFLHEGRFMLLVYIFTRIILLVLRSRGSTQLREKTKTRKELKEETSKGIFEIT